MAAHTTLAAVYSVAASLRALLGQMLRFVGAGVLVTCLYLGLTGVLASVAGAPFQAAVAIGYFTSVAVHFVLHRLFVFATDDEYQLGVGGQLSRYLVLVVAQYGVTAAAVAVLPELLGVDRFVAWLAAVVTVTP